MERAHVLIRLRDGDDERLSGTASESPRPETKHVQSGVCRTSATTVRLEHSDMSPGVASITFEQVFDQHHRNAEIFSHASVAAGMARVADGHAMTLVATGASQSGKSLTMHGNEHDQKGLIELAIAHVFSVAPSESQILFAAAYTVNELFVDAISGQQFIERNPVDATVDGPFLSIAKRVTSVEEATLAYRTALQRSHELDENKMASDFVCVLFVESRANSSGTVQRGRLVCIDIHGHGIIEPATTTTTTTTGLLNQERSPSKPSLFADTQFPVREPLTQWCGPFLGNDAATFIIVTIHKAARQQQQAIQSLLYACKAKEITSVAAVRHVDGFTECCGAVLDSSSTLPISNSEDDDDNEDDESELMFLGSPVSSTSSRGSIRSRRTATTQQSASDLLSERLRQAYHTVKRASTSKRSSPPVSVCEPVGEPADSTDASSTSVSMQTLHSRADAILRSLQQSKGKNNTNNNKSHETMTLLEKLDAIHVVYQNMDKALQHEASVKQKCVERISKLSQTMSFQVVEHEKQLTAKDVENQTLRSQLDQMQSKYDEAERTLENLQSQVTEAMKQTRTKSPARVAAKQQQQSNERVLLQQFSARLETAMLEAKSVVDHKDAIIRDMETRLAQLQATYASNAETQLREETTRWENQAAQFAVQRQRWDEEREALQTELLRCRADHEQDQTRWRKETASASTKLKEEWEERIETLRREMNDAGERARRQHAEQISLLGATIRGLEDQAQHRDDELRRALLRSVAADAARCAVAKQGTQLEMELSHVKAKLSKDKKKLEKKLRILMTERKQLLDDHSKLESDMASDVQRLNLELAAVRAELSSRDEELQRREQLLSQLEARASNAEQQCVVHKEQITVLQDCVAQLESDKQALDHELQEQTYSLEQRSARQLVETETQLSTEYELKLRDTMERHAAELLQRDLELSRLRSTRRAQLLPLPQVSSTQSSSSSSSVAASSCEDQSPQQHDLDQLERMIDSHNDHHHHQQQHHSHHNSRHRGSSRHDKLTKQKHKIAMLRQQVDALTHALAIANEQETLAKHAVEQQNAQYQRMMYAQDELLTQINQAKHENWTLSWALHVTEQRHQQRRQGVSTTGRGDSGPSSSFLSLSSSSCSSTMG